MEGAVFSGVKVLEELYKSKVEAMEAIKDFVNELYAILKDLEMQTIKEVEKVFCDTENTLKQEFADTCNEMIRVNNCREPEGRQSDRADEIRERDRMEDRTKRIGINSSIETDTNSKIIFNEDIYLRDILQQITSLGSVMTTKIRTHAYTVLTTRDVTVRLSSDFGTCNVTDVCLVGPSLVLLVDNCNKKLKRLHTVQMSVVDQLELSAHPYCACLTEKREAVVSLSNNSLQFVSLGNSMSLTRQLNLNHCCYGIACKGDKLFISDSSSCIYIYDQSGKLLQTVYQDNSGTTLFERSRQITVSDTGKELFVTDWTSKLTTLDINGKFLDVFTDMTLEKANGVNTDGRGNVFICGCTTRNVVQVGPDGKRKGIIARSSDNLIDNPYSICFVPGQCLLFVTQGNNDRVKVFYMK